jgi:transcriptional regulator with XRE-family HTH domain
MRRSDAIKVQRDVGRRVAEERVERGWSQEKFAVQVGVSLKYAQRVEAGRQNLSISSIVKFANGLGIGPASLFAPPTTKAPGPGRPPGRTGAKG